MVSGELLARVKKLTYFAMSPPLQPSQELTSSLLDSHRLWCPHLGVRRGPLNSKSELCTKEVVDGFGSHVDFTYVIGPN